MGKREENALATKKAIMKATSDLIAEKGYENVVVEDITKRAGIAKGTFYNYYKQKDDVLTEFANLHFAAIDSHAVASKEFDSIVLALSYYLNEYARVMEKMGMTRVRHWISFIILPSSLPKKYQTDLETVIEILQKGIDSGSLKQGTPVNQLAQFIITYLYGSIMTWTIYDQNDLAQEIAYFNKNILPRILEPYLK